MAGAEPGPLPGGRLDPEGPDPEGVPDPMPAELRQDPEGWEPADEVDPMEGEAPSG
ncbi:MAG: hypothetical protein M3N68_03715 [Actinomycetota bacterium]|nr:hypothetical protein [Actinomycetota bacterium]